VTTINTTWADTFFRIVDTPPVQTNQNQPPSPGDVALVRTTYFSGGRKVVFETTTCTVVTWPHVVCNLTFRLAGGHLVATDAINPMSSATQHIAITGGTGAYRSARGDVALRFTTASKGTAVFTIIT
jgi:hypothetical protein